MSVEKKEVGNILPDLKGALKDGDINNAFGILSNKIKSGVEYSKEFLSDLFRIAETVKNFDLNQTKDCCSILDTYIKK